MGDFSEFMRAISGQSDEGESDVPTQRMKLAPDIEAIRLQDSLAAFRVVNKFTEGMIVQQKREARIYRDFGDNDHGIVVEVLPETIISGTDQDGTPHYREPYDMIVGCIEHTPRGDSFCLFHVDSRRFEPVPEAELRLVTRSVS